MEAELKHFAPYLNNKNVNLYAILQVPILRVHSGMFSLPLVICLFKRDFQLLICRMMDLIFFPSH